MPIPLMLAFVSTLAFAIQFLIFVYLYASHKVRFFHYLLWAWGFFTASKGLKLVEAALPGAVDLSPLINAAGVCAPLCVLAAGLAYRWEYTIRGRDILLGTLLAFTVATFRDPGPGLQAAVGVLLASVQIAAGLAFWSRPSVPPPYRGGRLLAASLCLWGLYRMTAQFVEHEPGTTAHLAVHGMFVFFYFLSTFAIIIMVLDRARGEMASLKELNERLVDGLGEGLELVDGDFTIRHGNRWMIEQFGPVTGRRCYEVLTADGQRCPGCPMERRQSMDSAVRLQVDGAAGRRLLVSCSPVRQPSGEVLLLELVADVTEQERLRARLSEAERLATAGELAAAVAHEIRNPLAAIVNATTLLADADLLTADERVSTLGAMKQEARRLNRILSDFLTFARPRELKRLPGDVGQVVEHVAALIRDDPARAGRVQLDVRLDPAVPAAVFDADQLTQVLWNIALNGIEAMKGEGRLSLEVARRNGQVLIAVSDVGPGIPADEHGRIFEPFVSRKRGGTGLGLTIAQRIVAAHGGRIHVESMPGRGTRFTIALPVEGT
jgi:signal transduction histidine kinase